jgi:hypothetical protein
VTSSSSSSSNDDGGYFWNVLEKAKAAVKTFFTKLLDGFIKNVVTVGTTIWNGILYVLKAVRDVVHYAVGMMSDAFSATIQAISFTTSDKFQGLKAIAAEYAFFLKSYTSDLYQTVLRLKDKDPKKIEMLTNTLTRKVGRTVEKYSATLRQEAKKEKIDFAEDNIIWSLLSKAQNAFAWIWDNLVWLAQVCLNLASAAIHAITFVLSGSLIIHWGLGEFFDRAYRYEKEKNPDEEEEEPEIVEEEEEEEQTSSVQQTTAEVLSTMSEDKTIAEPFRTKLANAANLQANLDTAFDIYRPVIEIYHRAESKDVPSDDLLSMRANIFASAMMDLYHEKDLSKVPGKANALFELQTGGVDILTYWRLQEASDFMSGTAIGTAILSLDPRTWQGKPIETLTQMDIDAIPREYQETKDILDGIWRRDDAQQQDREQSINHVKKLLRHETDLLTTYQVQSNDLNVPPDMRENARVRAAVLKVRVDQLTNQLREFESTKTEKEQVEAWSDMGQDELKVIFDQISAEYDQTRRQAKTLGEDMDIIGVGVGNRVKTQKKLSVLWNITSRLRPGWRGSLDLERLKTQVEHAFKQVARVRVLNPRLQAEVNTIVQGLAERPLDLPLTMEELFIKMEKLRRKKDVLMYLLRMDARRRYERHRRWTKWLSILLTLGASTMLAYHWYFKQWFPDVVKTSATMDPMPHGPYLPVKADTPQHVTNDMKGRWYHDFWHTPEARAIPECTETVYADGGPQSCVPSHFPHPDRNASGTFQTWRHGGEGIPYYSRGEYFEKFVAPYPTPVPDRTPFEQAINWPRDFWNRIIDVYNESGGVLEMTKTYVTSGTVLGHIAMVFSMVGFAVGPVSFMYAIISFAIFSVLRLIPAFRIARNGPATIWTQVAIDIISRGFSVMSLWVGLAAMILQVGLMAWQRRMGDRTNFWGAALLAVLPAGLAGARGWAEGLIGTGGNVFAAGVAGAAVAGATLLSFIPGLLANMIAWRLHEIQSYVMFARQGLQDAQEGIIRHLINGPDPLEDVTHWTNDAELKFEELFTLFKDGMDPALYNPIISGEAYRDAMTSEFSPPPSAPPADSFMEAGAKFAEEALNGENTNKKKAEEGSALNDNNKEETSDKAALNDNNNETSDDSDVPSEETSEGSTLNDNNNNKISDDREVPSDGEPTALTTVEVTKIRSGKY